MIMMISIMTDHLSASVPGCIIAPPFSPGGYINCVRRWGLKPWPMRG